MPLFLGANYSFYYRFNEMKRFSYPRLKVTLLFGSVGLCCIVVISLLGFISAQLSKIDADGAVPKEGFIQPILYLIIPFILMIPHFLIIGGVLAYRQVTWCGQKWSNTATYKQVLKSNAIASMIIFLPFILAKVDVMSCLGYAFLYLIISLISAGLVLPKNNC